MIETEAVDRFPTLGGKLEMPTSVRFRGAKHRHTILGTMRYCHIRDWIAISIEYDTFEFLSKLGLVDNDEFSNRHCSRDEERTCKRDDYHSRHSSIIDSGRSQRKESHGCRNQAVTLKFRRVSIRFTSERYFPSLRAHTFADRIRCCPILAIPRER